MGLSLLQWFGLVVVGFEGVPQFWRRSWHPQLWGRGWCNWRVISVVGEQAGCLDQSVDVAVGERVHSAVKMFS